MTLHYSIYPPPENMREAECIPRGMVEMAAIEGVLVIASRSETAPAALVSIRIYIVMSAIMRWDPLYALIGILKQPLPDAPATVAPTSERHELSEFEMEHERLPDTQSPQINARHSAGARLLR
jgi:hypothetical protein